MTRMSVESIVRALNEADIEYLIAGGLAVVAHGHVRLTADLDLILATDAANLARAVAVLSSLEYRPRAPVPFDDFIRPEKRDEWRRGKGMVVFSLHSPRHPLTEIDLFVEPPLDFAAAYARAARLEVAPGIPATFVGLEDLLAIKRAAGRPQDLEDCARLTELHAGGGHDE
jgi:predicted nucleotidyltransferase